MQIYSIYDAVAKEFSSPFVLKNDDVAIRLWRKDCEKVPAEMLKDYYLCHIGSFCGDYDITVSPIKVNPVKIVLSGKDIIAEDTEQLKFDLDGSDDELA